VSTISIQYDTNNDADFYIVSRASRFESHTSVSYDLRFESSFY